MEVLIIGLGSIALKHINALKLIGNEGQIYALRSGNKAEELPGVKNIYAFDEISEQIDFAIISNPTSLHYQFIIQLMKRNIPLFVEKPVVHNFASLNKLSEKLKEINEINYVACNMRFHPCLKFLKDFLTKEMQVINEVNIYCGSYLPDWRKGKDYRQMYSSIPELGGGVHLDLFHELDYACWLFGTPKKSSLFKSNHSSLDISAADYANYLLNYQSFNVSIILNYYRISPKRSIEILFEKEIWTIDLIGHTIVNANGDVVFSTPDYHIITSYEDQMTYFIDCLSNNTKPMNGIKESLNILQFAFVDE